ncbi:MAG TPA: hypothetical protein VKY57_00435, partial [Chitinispirillaceae bacterium]|nr:hypothetical protein [Chitinispirillaceae bacterium]
MNSLKRLKLMIFVFLIANVVTADIFRVAKEGQQYSSIQKAVDAANPGDVILIMDAETYEEQVTIDSAKNGLTLRADIMGGRKPVIKYHDNKSINPESCQDAQDSVKTTEYEKEGTYFDQNGALRILKARGVVIENIIIDGGDAFAFVNTGVWSGPNCTGRAFDLFSGNAALNLWIAGDAVIRNCEIRNAYFGVYIKDRNLGGIYANANPSDNDSLRNVPLSGFGKSGNHLFEGCRIYENSWGMFFESAWDLGITVRYNLFYSNYHQSSSFANDVSEMGEEGANQCGGAILFKDVMLSPVSIYNNTFWDNSLNIAGQWQAGAQHLIFNNIFAEPNEYWGDDKLFGNNRQNFAMDIAHVHRLKHNSFACMQEPPHKRSQNYTAGRSDPATNDYVQIDTSVRGVDRVVIYNGLDRVEKEGQEIVITIPLSSGDVEVTEFAEWIVQPGALLTGGSGAGSMISESANNRWLEMKFKSTDPDDPDFLTPDWDDSIMYKYIVDQGWPEAGIRDADGSIADLGAIPMTGIPEDNIVIKPISSVIINDDNIATVSFDLSVLSGSFENPEIKHIKWINNVEYDVDSWGKDVETISSSDIITPDISSKTVSVGSNSISFSVPRRSEDELYAFCEIIVEGIGSDGKPVTSNVGFLPYRKLEYVFTIKFYPDESSVSPSNEINEVQVGQPVAMEIIPYKANGEKVTMDVDTVDISLVNSTFDLLDESGNKLMLDGISKDGTIVTVVFTKIPNNGYEIVRASGIIKQNSSDSIGAAIGGSSEEINILPGPPDHIKFIDPAGSSNAPAIINPGELLEALLQIYDQYGNPVIEPANVSIESREPNIGGPTGTTSGMSDNTGQITFDSIVVGKDGSENDVFRLVATLKYEGKENYDTTYLKVGKITDRFVIFYSDTNGYNPTIIIDECSSERVPVTIRAMA